MEKLTVNISQDHSTLLECLDLLHVTKRSHLPTALGPTLPSPKRGDREAEEEGGGREGGGPLWMVTQSTAGRQRERRVGIGGGGGGG